MTVRPTEFVAIAARGQEAAAQAVRGWADVARNYAANATAENPLPRPAEVHAAIDTWYSLASTLLSQQHALATTLVAAGTDAADAVVEQARSVGVPA